MKCLYRWAARRAKEGGWKKICSYTLQSEPGTSLIAAGFTPVARTKGGSWNCPSRPHQAKSPAQPEMKRMNMHIEAGLHDAFKAATADMGYA